MVQGTLEAKTVIHGASVAHVGRDVAQGGVNLITDTRTEGVGPIELHAPRHSNLKVLRVQDESDFVTVFPDTELHSVLAQPLLDHGPAFQVLAVNA